MHHPALADYISYEMSGDTTGTHLQGEINVAYSTLCEIFGHPNAKGDEYKVDAEWKLTFILFSKFHKVATIYNYKTGKNYLEAEGKDVEVIREWHIGGKEPEVVGYIASMIIHQLETTNVERA